MNKFKLIVSAMTAAAILASSAVTAYADDTIDDVSADVAATEEVASSASADESETEEAIDTTEPVGDYTEEQVEIYKHAFDGTNYVNYYITSDNTVTITGGYFTSSFDLVIPDKIAGCPVTEIADEAFYNKSMKSITIGNNVKIFGDSICYNCDSLSEVNLPTSMTSIPDKMFYDCDGLLSLTLPNSITSIGKQAFTGCGNLTLITLPSKLKSIGYNVFGGCTSLTKVTIPSTVTEIGAEAFYNCSRLRTINIPSGVTAIEEYTFYQTAIDSITIPSKLIYVGDYAFKNCDNLGTIAFPDTVKSFGYEVLYDCDSLTAVKFPANVTTIGNYACYDCNSLQKVTLPKKLKFIGYQAFRYCEKLMTIALPDTLEYIDEYAFDGCKKLDSITIPESVKYIENYAFQNCTLMTKMYIPNSDTQLYSGALNGCSCLTVYCNPGSKAAIAAGTYSYVSVEPMPVIPAKLSASVGINKVSLSWTAVSGATQYRIRRTNGTTWTTLGTVTTRTFSDTTTVGGKTYKYVVIPYVNGVFNTSGQSNTVSVTAKSQLPVIELTAQNKKVTVKWTAVTGATKYRLRRNDGTGWKTLTTTTSRSFTDTTALSGKSYTYSVHPYINGDFASPSVSVKTELNGNTASPALTVYYNNGRAKISWKAISGITRYRVRRNDGSGWTTMVTTGNTSWIDTTLASGKTYKYVVYTSTNGTTFKNPSSTITIRTW